jgi:hypothetical protein
MLPEGEARYFETKVVGIPRRAGDPIPTSVLVKLWDHKDGPFIGMISLNLRTSMTDDEVDETEWRACELMRIINENVVTVSFQGSA